MILTVLTMSWTWSGGVRFDMILPLNSACIVRSSFNVYIDCLLSIEFAFIFLMGTFNK